MKLGRKHPWKILYKDCSFSSDPLTNMTVTDNSCFWLHFAKLFQRRRFFLNQPIRNKNYLWRPCLLTDPDEMSNLYRGPAIDANFQVALHLTEGFLYVHLCCPSFYVTWSHFRYVWFSVFSKFLCHLISLPFCMGLYVVQTVKGASEIETRTT
jgi:hypothetical protein